MKEIPLTQGKVALVDDEDYELINQWKWYAHESGNTHYAKRNIWIGTSREHRRWQSVAMHRLILNAESAMCVDHIDGNGLNNTRANLRLATHQENLCNQRLYKNSPSGYKGVRFRKDANKWQARIRAEKKELHLGYFDTIEEAARAYDAAARKHFGEFANLNFQESTHA